MTGRHAYGYAKQQEGLLEQAADQLKTSVQELPQRIEKVLAQLKEQSRQLESLTAQLNKGRAAELEQSAERVGDILVFAAQIPGETMDGLLQLADQLKERQKSYVIVLGTTANEKVQLLAAVSKDLQGRGLHAGQLVKTVAAIVGGGGGGRPDLAQAGGKHPEKLPDAIAQVKTIVEQAAGISA